MYNEGELMRHQVDKQKEHVQGPWGKKDVRVFEELNAVNGRTGSLTQDGERGWSQVTEALASHGEKF